jgi:hypothetical protein
MHYHALGAQQKKILLTSKYIGIKNCKQKTQMGEKFIQEHYTYRCKNNLQFLVTYAYLFTTSY